MNTGNAQATAPNLSKAARDNSRPSIESAFETLQATVENLFDEIHRFGDRVSPILLEPSGDKMGPEPSPEPGSTVRSQLIDLNIRLNNACRDLSNYTARVDL